LGDIESHFPLEEEEKEKLCLLLFDEELRIRRAVSSFVKTVWEEEVDEKLGSLHKPSKKDMERMVLAGLLVKWAKALDDRSGDMAESKLKKVLMEGDNLSGEKSLSYLLPLRIKGGFPWLWRRFGMRSILSATGKTYWNSFSLTIQLRRTRFKLALQGEDHE